MVRNLLLLHRKFKIINCPKKVFVVLGAVNSTPRLDCFAYNGCLATKMKTHTYDVTGRWCECVMGTCPLCSTVNHVIHNVKVVSG